MNLSSNSEGGKYRNGRVFSFPMNSAGGSRKKGLNREILSITLGLFHQILTYKVERTKHVMVVAIKKNLCSSSSWLFRPSPSMYYNNSERQLYTTRIKHS